MKPTPDGWSRFTSMLVYDDAAAAIDWLCAAFGFKIKIKVEGHGGRIEHCELLYGEALLMVAQEDPESASPWRCQLRSPRSVAAANTQSLMIYVDDVDSHCARASACGARIVEQPALHDYGPEHWADRSYGALDPEGHLWWISERVRDPPLQYSN